MEIRAAVREFLLDRESFGRRPATLRYYRSNLYALVAFAETRGVLELDGLGRAELRGFFADLHRRGVSQDTLAAYDRAMRAFFAFCVAEGWLDSDPMANRPRLRQSRGLPDTLSMDDVCKLLAVCDDSPLGRRDRAIMLLMLDSGLRAGEVVGLTVDRLTLNGDRGVVNIPAVETKGEDDRTVPIWTKTVEAMRAWLEARPAGAVTVFVSSDGYRLTEEAMTVDGLNKMMHRRVEQAGVTGKRRLCHIWRHTFAKRYVLAGGDLETLRRLLGHRSLETVRIYLEFRTEELEQRHWELSPVRQFYDWQQAGGGEVVRTRRGGETKKGAFHLGRAVKIARLVNLVYNLAQSRGRAGDFLSPA